MHLNYIQQDLINFQKTTIVTSIKVHYKMFLPLGYGKQGACVQQMKIYGTQHALHHLGQKIVHR
jgi:hypothetical protein